MNGLRLGYHYHVPAIYRDGRIWMPAFQGRFLDALAQECQELVCFLHDIPRADEREMMDYPLQSSNVTLIGLGAHDSVPQRLFRSGGMIRRAKKKSPAFDVLLLRGPSPLLPAFGKNFSQTPLAVLLVGDNTRGLGALPQPLLRRMLIGLWAHWNKYQQQQIIRRSLTFVNSRSIYREVEGKSPRLLEVSTTTLRAGDFKKRTDTCRFSKIKLLYVGRMSLAKGLNHLLDAVSELRKSGEDVSLDLVGPAENNDPFLDSLAAGLERRGLSDFVLYHGYKSLGKELFSYYESADIFLIPSTSGFEGFPRTIWEAMAHGLPVIASRVGGIGDALTDRENALLIPPGNSAAIVDALEALINDQGLRMKMIENGFKLASGFTVESQAGFMARQLEIWCREQTVKK